LTNIVLPSNQGSVLTALDHPALSTVLRYRLDMGTRSALGGLVTDRRGSGYQNSVYGLDGQLQLSPKDRVLFQLLGSQTAYPDELRTERSEPAGPFNGSAWSVFYGHEARNWHWWTKAENLSRGFRADAGFIPRVDIRTAELGLRRVFWPEKESWYSRINLSLEGLYTEDQGGHLTDKSAELRAEINGPLRSTLGLGFVFHKELFKQFFFDQKYLDLMLNVQPRRDLNLLFSGKWGDAVDYQGARPARVIRANPALVFFLSRHLQLQVDQLWERLEVERRRLYIASLTQTQLVYMFNTRVFLRTILQYQDIDWDPALKPLTADPLTRHLFTQFLFSFKINPQTLFFLGYSDSSSAEAETSLKQKNRTFFLKLSYAWVQ
jgi:hypothetical protein